MDLREKLQELLDADYAIERELGGGGMSRVFVATEKKLGRKVVIKVLSTELAATLSTGRFEREIQLAASLQQANIVPVLTAGQVDGTPYYTMPFIEGESLRGRLIRGPFSEHEAVSILRDVARALVYAHERGIVHRDIKPDNVLLSGEAAVQGLIRDVMSGKTHVIRTIDDRRRRFQVVEEQRIDHGHGRQIARLQQTIGGIGGRQAGVGRHDEIRRQTERRGVQHDPSPPEDRGQAEVHEHEEACDLIEPDLLATDLKVEATQHGPCKQ